MMARLTREQLQTAYDEWPTPDHGKTTIRALVLRLRIEELVRALPNTVIAAAAGHSKVARRLRLTIGEPGLAREDRVRRLTIVRAVIAAYDEICDVLHGRNPDSRPALFAVAAWESATLQAETELAPAGADRTVPRPRASTTATTH